MASLVRLALPIAPTLIRRGQRTSSVAAAAAMMSASPATSAVAVPAPTSALVPEIGASMKGRRERAANSAMTVISPGAHVVVQMTSGGGLVSQGPAAGPRPGPRHTLR